MKSTSIVNLATVVAGERLRRSGRERCLISDVHAVVGKTIAPVVVGRAGRIVERSIGSEPEQRIRVGNPIADRDRGSGKLANSSVTLSSLGAKRVACHDNLVHVGKYGLVTVVADNLIQNCVTGNVVSVPRILRIFTGCPSY